MAPTPETPEIFSREHLLTFDFGRSVAHSEAKRSKEKTPHLTPHTLCIINRQQQKQSTKDTSRRSSGCFFGIWQLYRTAVRTILQDTTRAVFCQATPDSFSILSPPIRSPPPPPHQRSHSIWEPWICWAPLVATSIPLPAHLPSLRRAFSVSI